MWLPSMLYQDILSFGLLPSPVGRGLGERCPVVLEPRSSNFCCNYYKYITVKGRETDKMGPGAKQPKKNEVGEIHSQFQ